MKSDNVKLQALANVRYYTGSVPFEEMNERLRRGDIVGFKGHPTRSKTGELSILPTEVIQLTPCMHMLPLEHYGLKQQETR